MWDRLRYVWLPRLCFGVALIIALGLVTLVIAAPWIARDDSLLLTLLAHNGGVRGAAIASAVGLLVTATVFFRASVSRAEKRSPSEPQSGKMAGA